MAVSVRAWAAGNLTSFTGSPTSITAAKPSGLAVGDLWIIWHARRSTAAESGVPAGFTALGSTFTAANQIERIYYKIADAADVAGGSKSWTQTAGVATTVSHAITGFNPTTIFDSESPVSTLTSSGTTHNATGYTPDANGLTMVFVSAAITLLNYTPPSTQSGGWTEQHDTQTDGGAGGSRMANAMFYKARTAAQGATGTITFGTSASQQVGARVIHINDAAGDTTAPTAPTSLAASDVASPVLTWTQGTDAVGVTRNKIKRSTVSGSGYVEIADIAAATTYTDTTAVPGTTYYYVVTALDAALNESANSAQDAATTPPDTTRPSDVTGLSAAGGGTTTANLAWSAASDNVGVTGYDLYRAPQGGSFTFVKNVAGITTTDQPGAGTWEYKVKAKDAASNESLNFSNTYTITTTMVAPTGLVAADGTGSSVLTWNVHPLSGTTLDYYNVYRATSAGGTRVKVNVTPVYFATYTDTVAAGTYYYTVTAVDLSANESGHSNEDAATITGGAGGGTIVSRRQGAVTPSGFVAAGHFTGVTSLALRVSPNSDMTSPLSDFTGSAPDAQGYRHIAATGLNADTTYYWRWVMNGVMSTSGGGTIKTLPTAGAPTSFGVAMSSCTDHTPSTRSNSAVFDEILADAPRYLFHMGDEHYRDPTTTDVAVHRSWHEEAIANSKQQALYAAIPVGYIYSDHDFAGNNSSSVSTGAAQAVAAYKQLYPHAAYVADYDTGGTRTDNALDYVVQIGRVHFFHMDTRSVSSDRSATDNSSKTKLGTDQKTRLKNWLNHSSRKTLPTVIFTQEPWHSSEGTGDGWGRYTTERTEIINYISANSITNVVFVGGDAHMLGYQRSGTPGGWPVYAASAFAQSASEKGGPYEAKYPANPSLGAEIMQYGWMEFTDSGGTSITMVFTGRSSTNTTLLTAPTHTFTGVPSASTLAGAVMDSRYQEKVRATRMTDVCYRERVRVPTSADLRSRLRVRAFSVLDSRSRLRVRGSTSADLRSLIRARVSTSADLRAGLRVRASKTNDLRYAERLRVQTSADIRYGLLQLVAPTLAGARAELRFGLRQRSGGAGDVRYQERQRSSKTLDARYQNKQTARARMEAHSSLRARVAARVDGRYALKQLVRPTATDLRYAERQRGSRTVDARYQLRQRVTGARAEIPYRERQRSGAVADLRSRLAVRLSVGLDARYAIKITARGRADLRSQLRQRSGGYSDLRYGLLSLVPTFAAQSVAVLAYRERALASAPADLRNRERVRSGSVADARYRELVRARATLDVRYRELVRARASLDARYRAQVRARTTLDARYQERTRSGARTDIRYALYSLVPTAQTLAVLAYRERGLARALPDIRYRERQRSGSALDARYRDLVGARGGTVDLRYRQRTLARARADSRARLRQRSGARAEIAYREMVRAKGTVEILYRDLVTARSRVDVRYRDLTTADTLVEIQAKERELASAITDLRYKIRSFFVLAPGEPESVTLLARLERMRLVGEEIAGSELERDDDVTLIEEEPDVS